jgi:hypothetical protein
MHVAYSLCRLSYIGYSIFWNKRRISYTVLSLPRQGKKTDSGSPSYTNKCTHFIQNHKSSVYMNSPIRFSDKSPFSGRHNTKEHNTNTSPFYTTLKISNDSYFDIHVYKLVVSCDMACSIKFGDVPLFVFYVVICTLISSPARVLN